MSVEALLALALAQSNPAAGALVAPPHQWIVDYSRTACTLARRQGDEHSPIVAFNASLGREPGELVIMDAGEALQERLRGGNAQVRIDDGEPLTIPVRPEWRNDHLIIRLAPMPEDFLERIAGGHQLTISKGNQAAVTLALPNARAAIAQLTRCNDDLLQSWGIDVAARRALSRKPRARNFDWAFNLMTEASTYVIFSADISVAGRASACRILVSTRNLRLDRTVCDLVQGVMRFEPALDAQGRPVAAQYVTMVRWVVQSED
jgi:hypothetical protein